MRDSVLDEIVAYKRTEIELKKVTVPIDDLIPVAKRAPNPLDFVSFLQSNIIKKEGLQLPRLIAEIKHASPSRGVLTNHFNPIVLAEKYLENGASAISILTDEKFFLGNIGYLEQVSAFAHNYGPGFPVLRKDFIIDAYQVYESRAAGADAILLIAACLQRSELIELLDLSRSLGMEALIEVHDQFEVEKVLSCNPVLIGVNNRDLHNFTINLDTTIHLRAFIPDNVCLVSESGIHGVDDVMYLAEKGVDAILVGESLVTASDTAKKVRELTGNVG